MRRFDVSVAVYTGRVSKEIGFSGPLKSLRRKPQSPHKVCGFSVRAPSLGGSSGEASASPVSRKWFPGLLTRSSRRPHLAVSATVFANRNDLEATMAQNLALPVRTSAQIIALPNAAMAPIQQRRGPGRHPAYIVSLYRWRRDKNVKKLQQPAARTSSPASNLIEAQDFLAACERLCSVARHQLLVAQQQAGIKNLSLVISTTTQGAI